MAQKKRAFLLTVERSTVYRVIGPTSLLGEEGEEAFDYACDNLCDPEVTVEEIGGDTLGDRVYPDDEWEAAQLKKRRKK